MEYRNLLLQALPPKEMRLIVPHLRPVRLPKDLVLYETGQRIQQVYFPEDALISYLSGTSDGESIEVCVVGNEGLVGLTGVLSDRTTFRACVQIEGDAYALGSDVLRKEIGRWDAVNRLVLRYATALLVQLAQTAVCNKFHSVRERVARWLLMAHDRIGSRDIPVTQDSLSRILGSRRASISCVAGDLQKRGMIRYHRGVISILNRRALEGAACECYPTVLAAHENLASSGRVLSPSNRKIETP
jgi:CRP-like cAMP-binding protein